MSIEAKPFLELISPTVVALIGICGIVLSSVITYFLTRKKTRAEINKTEAETEKTEFDSIETLRKLVNEFASDLARVQKQQLESGDRISELQNREKKLRDENARLSERLKIVEATIKQEQQNFQEMLSQKEKEIEGLKDQLKQTIDDFEKQIGEKEKELQTLRREVTELKKILEKHNLQIDN